MKSESVEKAQLSYLRELMEILNGLNRVNIEESVVCVGTFDGLHLGHLEVINRTVENAKRLNMKSVVFTFWPHPQEVVSPDKAVYYLNTLEEKKELFAKSGIDYLVLYPFDKDFSQKSSRTFIKEFLIQKLKMKFFVIGYDHQFGKEREGKYERMLQWSEELDFGIERVSQKLLSDELLSSTRIRNLIKTGQFELANKLLSYTYFTSGEVIKGSQIGRSIGFPTANVQIPSNKLLPKPGVYIVEAFVGNELRNAVANIGFKPTVGQEKELGLEVHIFDFKEDIYTENIKVFFHRRIRDEKKFGELNALKDQIAKDILVAQDYFKNKTI